MRFIFLNPFFRYLCGFSLTAHSKKRPTKLNMRASHSHKLHEQHEQHEPHEQHEQHERRDSLQAAQDELDQEIEELRVEPVQEVAICFMFVRFSCAFVW